MSTLLNPPMNLFTIKKFISLLITSHQKEILKYLMLFVLTTRLTIAEKLIELTDNPALTNTEKQQLDFYKKEYAFEIKFIEKDTTTINEFFKFGLIDRFKLFKYYDEDFTI